VEKISTLPDIPGYKIIRELGRGGMAVAYLAVQDLFERLVALKVMMPASNSDEDFAKRFMREARIIGHLSHPNIVPVYEVGEREGQYFFSMEFLPDGDLESRIDNGLTTESVIQITSQVARALDYAHAHGVIHRDVKPDNILFRTSGEAVLTDFGIARDLDDSGKLTIVETIVGSPRYMSPEQAQGATVDTRSDIFSLGVVLYEMLTGNFPFDGVSAAAVALQQLEMIPLKLPPEAEIFQPLLDKMVTLAPSARFSTALALVDALDNIGTTVGSDPTRGFKADASDRIEDKPTVVFDRAEVESLRRQFRKPEKWWRRFLSVRWSSPLLILLGFVMIGLVFVLLNRTGTLGVGVESDASREALDKIPPKVSVTDQEILLEDESYIGPAESVGAEAFVSPGYYFFNPDGPSRTPFQQTSRQPILLPRPEEVYFYSDLAVGAGTITLKEFAARYPKSVFTEILLIKEGDEKLLANVQFRARAGEEAAQLVLSELTDAGWGVEENAQEALALARQAARFDYALGHYQVATILMQTEGEGEQETKLHLQKGVDAEFFLAMNTRADIYWNKGGADRIERALKLYRKSAALGDRDAMFKAGKIMLEEQASSGVKFEALTYLNRAAAKGHQGAILLLREEGEADGNLTKAD
jgi:serine/threonine protein kinase